MRKLSLILALVLVLAACGGADEQAAPTTAAVEEATLSAEGTSAPESAPTTATEDAAAPSEAADPGPSFDGPPAPDFELALADGSTFALSGEQKPVYVVFWAEW
jgi:ABC-type glycerol-3-phosphate transport system substrate-binding protein